MTNAYPLALAAGALLGLLWLGLAPFERQSKADDSVARIDAGLIALLAGLVGGRLAYVVTHWEYFGSRVIESVWFWNGGLSWAGAALAALLGVAIYDRLARRPFWPEADQLAIPAAIVGATSWLGCLVDACAYGRRAAPGLLTPPAPDLLGNLVPRWPTQAIGGVYTLLVLLVLFRLAQLGLRSGLLAAIALSLLSAGPLAIA
ncbi:MAG TPA: prolipoprotein diacylglyceryl transferase family protein, partial [Anaerolineales bacterium]|nr:prolipoprotein diacylglyceryl transferase family protein [Anaerolineales bacterium]